MVESSITFKKFKVLDFWQINLLGRNSIRKIEAFIQQNGKYYDYEAIWSNEIFEQNKLNNKSNNPIIKSVVRESIYWEETKSLGV